MAVDQRDHRADIGRRGIRAGRSRAAATRDYPTPRPNSTQPAASGAMPSPNANSSDAGGLHQEDWRPPARRRSRSPQQPSQQGAPQDRAERDQADRHRRERPRRSRARAARSNARTSRSGRTGPGQRPTEIVTKPGCRSERPARRRRLRQSARQRQVTPQETPRQRTDDYDRGAGHHEGRRATARRPRSVRSTAARKRYRRRWRH